MLTPIPPTFTPLTRNRFNRSSHRLLAAGAALGLLLTACGDDTNNAEAVNAAAEVDPAGEATEPTAEPTVEETPGLQSASDGDLEFAAWNQGCTWIGGEADGTPIEELGRACFVKATVTNNGAEPVKLLASLQVMVDANGETYPSGSDARWFFNPIEPGETVKATMGWGPLPIDVEIVEVRFAGSEDAVGVSFTFTDDWLREQEG